MKHAQKDKFLKLTIIYNKAPFLFKETGLKMAELI
ncbi:hypothetical protein SAMN06265348_108155 [Pedobacter westerhofensis]|uniref:Uncharacterized protein n=1 Tax=Pedobacter westerhofensis TaxID=425512 RepID=A0A521EHQ5_9SPHI|nr:hypothetical protein SAMN06265348_108155 [Pedobacter westerhofensis]